MNFYAGSFRAARALLDLGQAEVSARAEVDRNVVFRVESGKYQRTLRPQLIKLVRFYEKQGIEFVEATAQRGPGIKWDTGKMNDLIQRAQLRTGRAIVGLLQSDLAVKAQVSQSLISRFASGKTKSIPIDDFVRIATALNEAGVEFVDDPATGKASVHLQSAAIFPSKDL